MGLHLPDADQLEKAHTCSLPGMDDILVQVEVDLVSGLPGLSIVIWYLTSHPPGIDRNGHSISEIVHCGLL